MIPTSNYQKPPETKPINSLDLKEDHDPTGLAFEENEGNKEDIVLLNQGDYRNILFRHQDSCSLLQGLEGNQCEKISELDIEEEFTEEKQEEKQEEQLEEKRMKRVVEENFEEFEAEEWRENVKGDSKNIPKNYGKQIIKFIKENPKTVQKVLNSTPFTYEQFNSYLQSIKLSITKIEDLRNLWSDEVNIYAYPLRVISEHFMRKHSLHWIFNSRIQRYSAPVKYRMKLRRAVRNPEEFKDLQEF